MIGEGGEPREGSEGVEEVLVEVDGEGAMEDEFRQEQQLEKAKMKIFRGEKYNKRGVLIKEVSSVIFKSVSTDAIEKSTIAAVQKILPLGGRLRLTDVRSRIGRVQRSSPTVERSSRGERRGKQSEGEEGEEAVDLRDVLNRKKEKGSER